MWNLRLQKRELLKPSPWEMGEASQLRINDSGGDGLPETREHQEIMLPKTVQFQGSGNSQVVVGAIAWRDRFISCFTWLVPWFLFEIL